MGFEPGCSCQSTLCGKQPILQAERSLQNEEEEVCSNPSRTCSFAISHGLHVLPAATQELNHALLCLVSAWPHRIAHQTRNFYGIVGSKQKETTSASSTSFCLCHCCPQGKRGEAGGGEGGAGERGKNEERRGRGGGGKEKAVKVEE